jgi:hypothetical protein
MSEVLFFNHTLSESSIQYRTALSNPMLPANIIQYSCQNNIYPKPLNLCGVVHEYAEQTEKTANNARRAQKLHHSARQ